MNSHAPAATTRLPGIDAHTHSRFSDGTQTPTELVDEASQVGLSALGLTDHDTAAGWAEAATATQACGVGLLRGMEVSCRWDWISVHMLAYLFDPAGAELTAATQQARQARIDRTRIMAQRLSEDYPITWEDVEALAGPDATVGRPHLADALVAAGVVGDRNEAFARILSSKSRYYVSLPTVSPVEAIRMIHEAGGVAVFAHPMAASRGTVVPDVAFREMIEAGLDGLEVDHRDNPPAAREQLLALAADHDLIVTGSSDYHGTGKSNLLGEHLTSDEMLERIVERASGVEYLPGR